MELLVHLLAVLRRGGDVPGEALPETEVSCEPEPLAREMGWPRPVFWGWTSWEVCRVSPSLICGLWERKAAVVCGQRWGRVTGEAGCSGAGDTFPEHVTHSA